jgi:hypothetical protein
MEPGEVVTLTLPRGPGERNSRILDLCRGLKFNCGLAGRPLCEIKPFAEQWHRKGLATMKTQSVMETWQDVVHAWPRARTPLGNILASAMLRARRHLPRQADGYDLPEARLLLGLCYELSRLSPGAQFFLSSRSAALQLGIEVEQHERVSRMLAMFVADGLLSVVRPGNARQATRFKWLPGTAATPASESTQ